MASGVLAITSATEDVALFVPRVIALAPRLALTLVFFPLE
jgi:hypothetical protein